MEQSANIEEMLWVLAEAVAALTELAAGGTLAQVGLDTLDTAISRLQQMAEQTGHPGVSQHLMTARGQLRRRFGQEA
ncbi:hypothetical protein CLG96_05465 [Sphingomonas oleivorans]|uniref:Uncharacterized protein n=1 Tax=Sphingomonas oleivorans TaxID=1735121 RepID=A0A2T5FZ96_9SPHN|nr:hypothetical protein CLG96_05465 [Sphingomonas oleivorans]